MAGKTLRDLVICIKGAGEQASGIAWRLYQANLCKIVMIEQPVPLAVRREVSFCEAVISGKKTVEGVEALQVTEPEAVASVWQSGKIAVLVDPKWQIVQRIGPDVLVDAILAKRNLGTQIADAPLVIGLGPGFVAARDVHMVIETNRGHNLGKVIVSGSAEPNTGIPGFIGGYDKERVLRAPISGIFKSDRKISDKVCRNDLIGEVDGCGVHTQIAGIVRGLIRSGLQVEKGLKLGDIDPRGEVNCCYTISDKSRAVAGSVLEAILRVYNS